MAAGLKRDVKSTALSTRARLRQGFNFSVICTRAAMRSAPHNFSTPNDDAAHPGIWIGQGIALSRQPQRLPHKMFMRGAAWFKHVASLHLAQEMSQLVFLYLEVGAVAHMRTSFQRNTFKDLEPIAPDSGDLPGIVGEQVHFANTQMD